jgi:hypothetical protein
VAVRWLILAGIAVPMTVLLGWVLHVEILKRFIPGMVSMNPLTAVGFACAGSALWQLRKEAVSSRQRLRATVLGMVVLLIGLSKLLDLLLGTAICPDGLLFSSQLNFGQTFPSRIAPNAAVCMSLLGGAILAFDRHWWPTALHPQRLMLPIFVLSWAALVGYTYNASDFYRYRAFIPMAVHTAICFLFFANAIMLSRPQQGFMKRLQRGSLGVNTFVKFLPACVLVPLLLGGAELAGLKAGNFGIAAGASLASVVTTVAMTLLAYATAVSLNRIDAQRRRVDQALLERQEQERRAHQLALSLAELEETLRNSRDDLQRGAAHILSMLVGKTGALQAGLYQVTPEPGGPGRLRVLSLYAYDRPQQVDASYAIGEGLVGQCAAVRQPLHIGAVPPNYFRLRSANIEALPGHLLFLPILLDDEVLGVLELASAAPPSEEVERFLNSALRIIAFGIYRYNRVRQAQGQADELQRLRRQHAYDLRMAATAGER